MIGLPPITNDNWDSWEDDTNDTWDTWEEEEPEPVREEIAPAVVSRDIIYQPPAISGPIIKFDNVSFLMVSPYDSVTLENTSGSLEVNSKTFVGEGGTFKWPKGIEKTEEATAEFSEYNFKVVRTLYQCQEYHIELSFVDECRGKR